MGDGRFFFWFTVIWMFISIFADILRRDMSEWADAGWILLIVALPLLGMLIYLVARTRMEDRQILANGRTAQNGPLITRRSTTLPQPPVGTTKARSQQRSSSD